MLDAKDLVQAIEGCRILISNDYELDLIMSKTGLNKNALHRRVRTIIVTLGELGSRVSTPNDEFNIPAVRPRKVEDPTGAGDSYRGGLISGLIRGKDIEQAARMGSVCASFAVECYGTQEYTFTPGRIQQETRRILRIGSVYRIKRRGHRYSLLRPARFSTQAFIPIRDNKCSRKSRNSGVLGSVIASIP